MGLTPSWRAREAVRYPAFPWLSPGGSSVGAIQKNIEETATNFGFNIRISDYAGGQLSGDPY